MLTSFQIICLFVFVGLGACMCMVMLSWFRGKQNPYSEKNLPYECGLDPFNSPHKHPFKVQFYSVGLLFIILDVEIALLIPWAYNVKELGVKVYYLIVSFFLVLGAGFFYEWKKGFLDWK